MKLTVTLVEVDPQTKKPAVQMHHFCISMCQARGMETTAFAVGDGFIQKLCKKCEKSGENYCPWATTFIAARQNPTVEVTGTVKCSFPPSSTA